MSDAITNDILDPVTGTNAILALRKQVRDLELRVALVEANFSKPSDRLVPRFTESQDRGKQQT